MRDPNRIDKLCDELKTIWHQVPDWRFGQFILNMERACHIDTGKDVFYLEDDDFFKFMKEYFKKITNE